MKCQCEFRIKVVVPFGNKKCSTTLESCMEAQIFVHLKHIGHNPGTEVDKMFLPSHPMVISFATENLKHMISTSTVALVSVREEIKMQAMVPDIEQTIYPFFLIPRKLSNYHTS